MKWMFALIFLIGCAAVEPVDVNVEVVVQGNGAVASSPEGITCGNVCQGDFDANTTVTLTATPLEDAMFSGWSGDCSGTSICSLTVDGNKQVTATFTANPLRFNLPANLPPATKGVNYEYDFGLTNPQGGKEPYRFQLATGVGFPPFGITVRPDSTIGGTPTTIETRTFDVCVVDFSGYSECKTTTLQVLEDEFPTTWVGEYDLSSDISVYCGNLPIITHEGEIRATLELDGEKVKGFASLDGVKSVTIDGYGDCSEEDLGVLFEGPVTGTKKGDNIKLTINFGDPDLFVNELFIEGELKEGTIVGDVLVEGAEGSVTLRS